MKLRRSNLPEFKGRIPLDTLLHSHAVVVISQVAWNVYSFYIVLSGTTYGHYD